MEAHTTSEQSLKYIVQTAANRSAEVDLTSYRLTPSTPSDYY